MGYQGVYAYIIYKPMNQYRYDAKDHRYDINMSQLLFSLHSGRYISLPSFWHSILAVYLVLAYKIY